MSQKGDLRKIKCVISKKSDLISKRIFKESGLTNINRKEITKTIS